MSDIDVSRREVLASIGTGVGALTVGTGTGGAEQTNDTGRHIAGAESDAAVKAAKDKADSVYRVIELGQYPTAIAGVFSKEARKQLDQRSDVAYVEKDIKLETIGQVLPWGIDRVDADVAHAKGETGGDSGGDGDGDSTDIAIIDTGIDDDHPDLHDNLATPLGDSDEHKAFATCKGPNCNYPWSDDHDHGTHVSGIADSINNSEGVVGVSTEATLHAAKVCDKSGFCSASDIAAALKWTADHNYDVANLSLGGSYSSTIDDAGKYAYDNGVLLVAAAGNDGPCTDCVSYPAANEEFIAVSATTKNDDLADFSSTGCEVELAAPGKDIYSTVIGGYDTFSGTSMAAPHVSGAGAQLMDNGYVNAEDQTEDGDCYPPTPGGARGRLQDTAEDIGLTSNKQGEGLLDVEAALGLTELSVDSLSADEVETSDDDAEFDVSWSVSDPEGELESLDLVLYDKTADTQDDSKTVDVSGDKESGTTRLIANGDEASGHSYDVTATVTDKDGNTASKTVSTSETEDKPTVDSLSLTEVETSDDDAEFDADWDVSDADGDLESLDLVLTDTDDGETEDSKTVDVSGDSASGTTRLVATGEDGSGHTYKVTATVSDTDGTSSSDTATATESEDTESAPTIDKFDVSSQSPNNPHAEIAVDWAVSDADDNLDTVEVIVDDTDESETFSSTTDVSGGSASGTDEFKDKFDSGEYDVTLTVTDTAGNSTSDTKTVTA